MHTHRSRVANKLMICFLPFGFVKTGNTCIPPAVFGNACVPSCWFNDGVIVTSCVQNPANLVVERCSCCPCPYHLFSSRGDDAVGSVRLGDQLCNILTACLLLTWKMCSLLKSFCGDLLCVYNLHRSA